MSRYGASASEPGYHGGACPACHQLLTGFAVGLARTSVVLAAASALAQQVALLTFADVTPAAGLTYVHETGAAGDKVLPGALRGRRHSTRARKRAKEGIADPTPIALARRSSIAILAAGSSRTSQPERASTPDRQGHGAGVLDYNVDGWPDVFVGSDRVQSSI
jgi:hypothetical protein